MAKKVSNPAKPAAAQPQNQNQTKHQPKNGTKAAPTASASAAAHRGSTGAHDMATKPKSAEPEQAALAAPKPGRNHMARQRKNGSGMEEKSTKARASGTNGVNGHRNGQGNGNGGGKNRAMNGHAPSSPQHTARINPGHEGSPSSRPAAARGSGMAGGSSRMMTPGPASKKKAAEDEKESGMKSDMEKVGVGSDAPQSQSAPTSSVPPSPYDSLPPVPERKIESQAAKSGLALTETPDPKPARKDLLVYFFGEGKADGRGDMKPLLGGKGAGLAEMTRIGLPVPPGFTITTEVCTAYYENNHQYPPELEGQISSAMQRMENLLGKKFGGVKEGDPAEFESNGPLLVAVRSGARDSMPGMMDTILNLGLNDETVLALAKMSNNERFAYDCYRRFIQMYGDVVMGVQKREGEDDEPFEVVMEKMKRELWPDREDVPDTELNTDALKELVKRFKALVKERTGKEFPSCPMEQLQGAIGAVFGSWNNERAIVYRHKYGIPSEWGTAVNVQAMVFGNTGDHSGSGVAFTRDPATGEKRFYGEYLINAQGEDVVAGVRTPVSVEKLEAAMPQAYKELEEVRAKLEGHFREMQDFEFTIEDGKLYMLQTRNGKRTGVAAVRIAVEMVKEGLITWEEAVTRVPADQLDQLLTPVFDRAARKKAKVIARGLPAGPGAATGRIYFNANEAEKVANHGEKVLLVRVETSPEDIRGMLAAEGILTARGGVSSHAALVARQMGKVCVCGASDLHLDYEHATLTVGGTVYKKGDFLSIDGTSGEVFAGELKTAPSEIVQVLIDKSMDGKKSAIYRDYSQLMEWADKVRTLGIRTNADQPDQVANAVAFGAEGVGLCRTEHMFFNEDRIDSVREMILAETREAREKAVAKLLPYQQEDFSGIFRALNGLPATIRLLDPPLHEFLPQSAEQQSELAKKLGVTEEKVKQRVAALHEFNPMLGHRGCRLGITYPEISAMQARAIFQAALAVQKEGIKVKPEIMIPLVGFPKELEMQVKIVKDTATDVLKEANARRKGKGHEITLDYSVGTMIEIPRACLVADKIAMTAEFFSFGTNDLTQTALGMSRDDSGSFLPEYHDKEIVKHNPFASIDQEGVGELMKIAIEKGRSTRKEMKMGICGEHGGEPHSVKFCHHIGLDYVSCSPFRVPIARLAAAQAALVK
ncbi:MAG TPA: pyruvate, phosphate dikinase [Candidatus Methylacidiphilales bacterium]|nr:pyruvate, phosphate dikinase [Candidatus Methylacidiphilales bacterium]